VSIDNAKDLPRRLSRRIYTCKFKTNAHEVESLACHSTLCFRATVLLLVAVLIIIGAACHKADPDVVEILRAAGNGNLAKARLLLDRNPSLVFGKNKHGLTALHYSASYGYMQIAELLLAKNADVNAKTDKGATPLHYAATYGYGDVAQLLISNKADLNVRDGIGRTPLYDAATSGRIEEVRILLAAKADVNAGTLRGNTPLSGAASRGREDIVRLLVDAGANVNAADFDGGTPLHWARIGGHKGIEDLLRQHGGLELPRATSEWPYP
jgi:ankyrin repeat protein